MPPIAVHQLQNLLLTHSYRGQAPSYIFNGVRFRDGAFR